MLAKAKWLFAWMVLCMAGCAGSTDPSKGGTVKDVVPFNVGKAGATATYSFHVSWMSENYPRVVVLMINPPNNKWLDQYGKSRSILMAKFDSLIESITGKKHSDNSNSKKVPHKGIRLHVVWKDKDGQIIKEIDKVAQVGQSRVLSGNGEGIYIDYIPDWKASAYMPPGNYTVTVTALDDDLRFDGTFETGLFVGYTWK